MTFAFLENYIHAGNTTDTADCPAAGERTLCATVDADVADAAMPTLFEMRTAPALFTRCVVRGDATPWPPTRADGLPREAHQGSAPGCCASPRNMCEGDRDTGSCSVARGDCDSDSESDGESDNVGDCGSMVTAPPPWRGNTRPPLVEGRTGSEGSLSVAERRSRPDTDAVHAEPSGAVRGRATERSPAAAALDAVREEGDMPCTDDGVRADGVLEPGRKCTDASVDTG